MKKFANRNNASQQGNPQQTKEAQQPPPNQEKALLNAANLREHHIALQAERAASMQRHHSGHGSRAPPAPTSDKPPFQLGPQSPHGNPLAYGPPTLTAAQLVLPQNKRRRSNNHQPSGSSTPVQTQETLAIKSSPTSSKLASPEAQRVPVPQMSFKCGVSDCRSGQKGFLTQAELEQHNIEAHEPKEPVIEDPVEFALESMRIALGLDEHGNSKPPNETLEAPKMKVSLSAQSHKAIKQEASTPMARATTQNGPSPAPSSLLKTPQASQNMKSPASDARSTTQESRKKTEKGATTSPKASSPPPLDPWAGSLISSDTITSAWSSLADMNSLSFTKIQMGLTPSSTLSSGNEKSEKNSPRTSDISENDAVKINIDVGNEEKDNWIPSEWFNDSIYGDIQSLNFGQDGGMAGDMDWDIFGDDVDAVMEDAGKGKGKKVRDEDVVSEEWLKVYAPEKLPVKKGGR
ncbi:MAG: hypothetical protein Q9222_007211 [Ikaeria aurantiellina]